MERLASDWFATGTLDFEYKQYVLLAYLQHIQRRFTEARLYPPLSDLLHHTRTLEEYQASKQQMDDRFPQTLTGIDLPNARLVYEKQTPTDSTELQEIDAIVAYALPQLRRHLQQGREIYEHVNGQLHMKPIGVLPLYRDEGYVFIRPGVVPDVAVFQYQVRLFGPDPSGERLAGIHTQYVTSFSLSLTENYHSIKLSLIRHRAELPNPATFAVECVEPVPIDETLLPVTKRRLLRLLAGPDRPKVLPG